MTYSRHDISEFLQNPFIEGSEEVPADEVAEAAKALAEEAQVARHKAIEIKERLSIAKAAKEKATREREAREKAAIEAARAQIIRTISKIPRNAGANSLRPDAPSLKTNSDIILIAANRNPFEVQDETNGILSLAADFFVAVITLAFAFLLLQDILPFLN